MLFAADLTVFSDHRNESLPSETVGVMHHDSHDARVIEFDKSIPEQKAGYCDEHHER